MGRIGIGAPVIQLQVAARGHAGAGCNSLRGLKTPHLHWGIPERLRVLALKSFFGWTDSESACTVMYLKEVTRHTTVLDLKGVQKMTLKVVYHHCPSTCLSTSSIKASQKHLKIIPKTRVSTQVWTPKTLKGNSKKVSRVGKFFNFMLPNLCSQNRNRNCSSRRSTYSVSLKFSSLGCRIAFTPDPTRRKLRGGTYRLSQMSQHLYPLENTQFGNEKLIAPNLGNGPSVNLIQSLQIVPLSFTVFCVMGSAIAYSESHSHWSNPSLMLWKTLLFLGDCQEILESLFEWIVFSGI